MPREEPGFAVPVVTAEIIEIAPGRADDRVAFPKT